MTLNSGHLPTYKDLLPVLINQTTPNCGKDIGVIIISPLCVTYSNLCIFYIISFMAHY